MPGWNLKTWGYHGDDGISMNNDTTIDHLDTYTVRDTVGCGVDRTGNLFFTKNGRHLGNLLSIFPVFINILIISPGISATGVCGQLFPIVSVGKDGDLSANFGTHAGGKPFMYNPDAVMETESETEDAESETEDAAEETEITADTDAGTHAVAGTRTESSTLVIDENAVSSGAEVLPTKEVEPAAAAAAKPEDSTTQSFGTVGSIDTDAAAAAGTQETIEPDVDDSTSPGKQPAKA